MAASQSILEIIIQAVDQASQQLDNIANGLDATGQKALTAQQQLQQYGQALTTAGLQLTVAGAAIDAFYAGVISAAASTQESQDSLATSVADIVNAAQSGSQSQSSYATQVAFLKDKIDAENASIAEATATLDKNSGSAESVAASHQKAAASIATAQENIQKYQQQLDLLTASQGLVGASTEDIVSQFENLARTSTDLGFSISDSEGSLKNLFAATKSAPDAVTAYETAMDLARAKNEDLATATQQVIMAMQGQGRSLIGVGITIKDGLSGMQALAAIQGVVGGQAEAYSDTLAGQMTIALQNINKLFTDMGNTQLPVLTAIFQAINNVIVAVDNWTLAHPKLTEALLVFVGVLGVLLTILGTVMLAAGALALALAAGLSAAFIGIAAAVAVGGAAIAAIAVLIVTNWGYIRDNFIAAWQIISTGFTTVWTEMKNTAQNALLWISNLVNTSLSAIQAAWNAIWGAVASFFSNIWTGIESTASTAINSIMSKVQAFVTWAESILGPILGAINAVGSAASVFGKGVAGVVSSAASVLNIHDAIITPSGQVIQSDPADYLFATKTPGSLGAGAGVTVNINGGMFLSDQSATLIANQVAKMLTRQLRLQNYKS